MGRQCRGDTSERKAAVRSRYGCRNCKLRKLKCDESRPECKRCSTFGLRCNFLPNIDDLQPSLGNAEVSCTRGKPALCPRIGDAVWTCNGVYAYHLNARCQDFITSYLGRNLLPQPDKRMRQVNLGLLDLAFKHPCLMHASLAVAFTYDRYINGPDDGRGYVERYFHYYKGAALLNRHLRRPLAPGDKDAIWGTAAALFVLSVSCPQTTASGQPWPIRPADEHTLTWIRVCKGKMSLWNLVDPLRLDSVFSVMASTYAEMQSPHPVRGIDGIPSPLADVCSLDNLSTAENNSYFCAAHAVAQISSRPDSEVSTVQIQAFFDSIHGAFEQLLEQRDPVALLLLYLWYRKAGLSVWWIDIRARLEGPAIHQYLRSYHAKDCKIQSILSKAS